MKAIHEYTIKLIRYVLDGEIPKLPNDIDFKELYKFAENHGVENIIYIGLSELNINVPDDIMNLFSEAHEMQIMIEATQALELEEIEEGFEKNNFDYVVFKGSQLKYLYPMPDYRKSGDIDILVRLNEFSDVCDFMQQNGYSRMKEFETYEVHEGFEKQPYIEVEIHRQMVKESNRAYKFCLKAWDNVHRIVNTQHRYEFDNEFMYAYLLAHLCNHIVGGGAGIRMLMDFHIVRKSMKFDEKKLDRFIEEANLKELNSMVIKLIDKWFGENNVSDKSIDAFEEYVFNGGSFGTYEQLVLISRSDNKKGMIIRILKTIFKRKKYLENDYPCLKKYSYIVLWLYNVYYQLKYRRKNIKGRLADTVDKKENDLENLSNAVRNR